MPIDLSEINAGLPVPKVPDGLESVSGGIWGKDTGGLPRSSAAPEAEADPPAPITSRSVVKRDLPLAFTHCLSTYRQRSELVYITADSKTWEEHATPYNLRIKGGAGVIVFAKSIAHVQEAVKCAFAHKVPVQARSGGHSYGAFSSAIEGGMVIDLRDLDEVKYDDNSKVAIVEGGTRLG